MPALLVQRRYYDEKERLIELAINHFPSGRYSYSVSYWRGQPCATTISARADAARLDGRRRRRHFVPT